MKKEKLNKIKLMLLDVVSEIDSELKNRDRKSRGEPGKKELRKMQEEILSDLEGLVGK